MAKKAIEKEEMGLMDKSICSKYSKKYANQKSMTSKLKPVLLSCDVQYLKYLYLDILNGNVVCLY